MPAFQVIFAAPFSRLLVGRRALLERCAIIIVIRVRKQSFGALGALALTTLQIFTPHIKG